MKKNRSSYIEPEQRMKSVQSLSRKMTPIAKVAPAQQRGDAGAEQIGRTCAVLGCDRYKRLPNHLLFRFPEEAALRGVWTETTGRAGWTPNDYSYVCAEHFAADCVRRGHLERGSVPTLQLPPNVMQVEYVNEEILDKETIPKELKSESESEPDTEPHKQTHSENIKTGPTIKLELLKLFSDVQLKQKQVVAMSKRLQHDRLVHRLRTRNIQKLKEKIKQKEMQQTEKKILRRARSPDTPIDKNAILVLPHKYTDEVRSFALNVYDKSPEAYVYLRNTLRTLLPETEELERWTANGFQPAAVMGAMDCLKIVTEAKERELSCKIAIV